MKTCPYCAEDIEPDVVICPHCRSDVTVPPRPAVQPQSPPPGAPGSPPPPRVGEGALRFSHSGDRYMLGYGADYFGIWDRTLPGPPVLQFPRTDEGWNSAWNQFSAREPRSVIVPQAAGPPPDVRAASGSFRSIHSLSAWVIGFLAIVALLDLAAIAFRANELSLLHRAQLGHPISRLEANANDTRLGVVGGLEGLAFLTVAVLWLVWQHRAHSNLRPLGSSGLKFTPGWVVAWWFVPVADFAMPYLTVREAWKASDPRTGAIDWASRRTSPLLWLWWIVWLGSIALASAASTAGGSRSLSIAQMVTRDQLLIAGLGVRIVAAALAALVVRDIDRREAGRHERAVAYASHLPGSG